MARTKSTPRGEALGALFEIRKALLDHTQDIDGLLRRQLAASVDYAIERVTSIEELRRARPKRPAIPVGLAGEAGETNIGGSA